MCYNWLFTAIFAAVIAGNALAGGLCIHKEKDMAKAIPADDKKIKTYLSMRSSDETNEALIIDLVNYLNQ